MNATEIQKIPVDTLINNGLFSDELYAEVLHDYVDEIKESLKSDADDAIFCIVVENAEIAMFMHEKNGAFHINTNARNRLINAWKTNYKTNIEKLLPIFSKQLASGQLAVAGVKYI